MLVQFLVSHKKVVSGPGQAQFLGRSDRLGSRYQGTGFSATYFDKHETGCIDHDEINLSPAAVVVATDCCQTLPPEGFFGDLLGFVSGIATQGLATDCCTEGSPRMTVAQPRLR